MEYYHRLNKRNYALHLLVVYVRPAICRLVCVELIALVMITVASSGISCPVPAPNTVDTQISLVYKLSMYHLQRNWLLSY